ncbi:TLC domain-containing protein 4-B-like [Branchiostoma lanceolatum]|uniref:TLC domain-containing protein 4-B-like n=1 Tax=Branchiostoma lanceolatum TaxID=7740 RepID=UPI003453CF28
MDWTLGMDIPYYATVFGSLAAFLLMYRLLSPWILRRMFPSYYHTQPDSAKPQLHEATMAACSSIVVGIWACSVYFLNDNVKGNLIRYDAPSVRYNCAIFLGYAMADSSLMAIHPQTGGALYHIHHAVSLFVGYVGVFYSCFPYHTNLGMLMELSNPFLNLRYIHNYLEYPTKSLSYFWNGAAFLLTFFLVRVVSMGGYWYNMSLAAREDDFYQLNIPVYICYLGGGIVFSSLNAYWFSQLCKEAYKVLTAKKED